MDNLSIHGVQIAWHLRFVQDVARLLIEVQWLVPKRLPEGTSCLPVARYDPIYILSRYPPRQGWQTIAISSGVFAIDSSDYGYKKFCRTYFHEVGHNIDSSDLSGEDWGDFYAGMTLAELTEGRRWYPIPPYWWFQLGQRLMSEGLR
jgi:hypothetical protein